MASNAAKYFLAGALFIAISFTTLITSDSITDHLGIETTNDCTDDDEDDCYEWPNETGCTIILGILCMGLIGLYCLVLSITSLVVGEGENPQTNVQMIPGGPQPQPDEGKKSAIMAIALIIIPLIVYNIFMTTGGMGIVNDCGSDNDRDLGEEDCLQRSTAGYGIMIIGGLLAIAGTLSLITIALKSIFKKPPQRQ